MEGIPLLLGPPYSLLPAWHGAPLHPFYPLIPVPETVKLSAASDSCQLAGRQGCGRGISGSLLGGVWEHLPPTGFGQCSQAMSFLSPLPPNSARLFSWNAL